MSAVLVAQAAAEGSTLVAQNIFFGIIALIIVFAAFRVVTTRNVVHAALYLVLVLAGVAAIFVLLTSEFIAVTQVLVYIGAIVVLLLFGIMLTEARLGQDQQLDNSYRLPAALTGLALLGSMAFALWDFFEDRKIPSEFLDEVGETERVSDSIFADYIIPFEATSVLLLAALIGAIVLARKE